MQDERLHQKIQSWANTCAVYEKEHVVGGDFSGVEYYRGAKEAFQRVADALATAPSPASAPAFDALKSTPGAFASPSEKRLQRLERESNAPTDGLAALVAKTVEKLREQAHEAESPYFTKTPEEIDYDYLAKAFRDIADELEAALAARESVRERVLAYVRANYSYLNTLPEALEKIFDTYGIPADLDKSARR
jgi:hypothetical protein